MSDIEKLAEQMKADWDRRIRHDYRFWMSDGQSDDATMWQTGERDLEIITRGISNINEKSILELGCGVGRLLRPALARFQKVIGVDVSVEAIQKARGFLGEDPKLELVVGNGFDLHEVKDNSIDVGFSFAAITSIPTKIIANYLLELNRVIKPGGELRLQVYLGENQAVHEQDTLYLRCYQSQNFEQTMRAAGFQIDWSEELVLPTIQVSAKDQGIVATIVALTKLERSSAKAETIAQLLLPEGEITESDAYHGSDLEYWMSLQYAKEQIRQGDREAAERAIEHAVAASKQPGLSVQGVLNSLEREIHAAGAAITSTTAKAGAFDANMQVLLERFPKVAEQIRTQSSSKERVSVQDTAQGPVLLLNNQCMDHPSKPVDGARVWSERLFKEDRFKKCKSIVVLGFAAGYHIEALRSSERGISVIEPSVELFKAALRTRDLTAVLREIKALAVGTELPGEMFEMGSELAVRPQTQAEYSTFCQKVKGYSYETRGLTALHPTIAVLGPIQGGTLPILGYTGRGLAVMNQRHREIDMSGFASGYHLLDGMVREELRKSVLHGNYIECISQSILEQSYEKPFDILICMAQAPISGRALNELRKRGVTTVLWFVEDYLRFSYWKNMAQYYDFIFTIQRDECIEQIRKAGAGEVHYLPVACDPCVHVPLELKAEERARWGSPLSFVGAGYYNRQQSFASFAEMPLKIWGTEWPTGRPFDRLVQEGGRRLAPEEYVKIFNATDVNINLHSSAERDDVDPFGDFVNPRTFELASCGAFQLVDERKLLPELFTPGSEVVTFKDRADLREKCHYYLERPEERRIIAERARKRVLDEHTYGHRIKKMLSIIYGSKFEHLSKREEESAWGKMLRRSRIDPELERRCRVAFERGEGANLDGLVADIMTGQGKLTETEQKLLFLFHIRKQIINMTREEQVTK